MLKTNILFIPVIALLALFTVFYYLQTLSSVDNQIAQAAADQAFTTVNISGTVNGPSGGVPGVQINIFSNQGSATRYTNASGFYSITLTVGNNINFKVRPPVAGRLSQANTTVYDFTSEVTQNFTVTEGYLISVLPTGTAGEPITQEIHMAVLPLQTEYYDPWYYELEWNATTERFEGVLPKDIHYIKFSVVPQGYFPTFVPVDLRTSDQQVNIPLNTYYVNPNPQNPPDVSKINVGAIDEMGEATVTGAPGAALPLMRIFIANLKSTNQAYTISDEDGSFTARIFAPPGSQLMIKQGPADIRWAGVHKGLLGARITSFPGTILYIPAPDSPPIGAVGFATVGGMKYEKNLVVSKDHHLGAAWAMHGIMRPLDDTTYQITSTIRFYSHAITPTTPLNSLHVTGELYLSMQSNAQGISFSKLDQFMSSFMTPSKLPVETRVRTIGLHQSVSVSNWRHISEHSLEGEMNFTFHLPNLPDGIYRPLIFFPFESEQGGIPQAETWLWTEVSGVTWLSGDAPLPPITVGTPDAPRQPWMLLANNLAQGQHGVIARQDKDNFGLSPEIVSQGATYYIPPIDVLDNTPIKYRLEPFLPKISYGERGHPGPPSIPFLLPGGQLTVKMRMPDGQEQYLGSAPFKQSFNITPSARYGNELNPGTVQLDDLYSLSTMDDRFAITFDQYGHHVITMTGWTEDIWGNIYNGGGTYDVWVAHALDIDPGVLPGTPLAVGDTFNPSLQIMPRFQADVTIKLTIYPASDPLQAIIYTISGLADTFGYFSPPGSPVILSQPGEYRVDLTASYTDATGKLFMGSMTWGGIIMTPPASAQLIAHGRRGYDIPTFPDLAWFVGTRDVVIPSDTISHLLPPYHSGDLIWSRMSDYVYGDSLTLNPSLQDNSGGFWETILESRLDQMDLTNGYPPNDMVTRFQMQELPVFISTLSGLSGVIDPGQIDQIAYSYNYSERPGVRVREFVAEEFVKNYWRLDTLYDNQLGDGIDGDLPHDFKFQFMGIVFRDLINNHQEYLGYASGWVFLEDNDALGSRVMPPFSGQGNGGWTTDGGPIMVLQNKPIDMFILPSGVQPGAVLTLGDRFRFAGQIMPTLSSQVAVTVTAPNGVKHLIEGQANSIGYFYNPAADFIVDQPGRWAVDVKIWHDGLCSGGHTVPPYPQGDVLGSEFGRYFFYVVDPDAPRLNVLTPQSGFLHFGMQINPIIITGQVPPGLGNISLDYTIHMPGFILEHGQVTPIGNIYRIVFDPVSLAEHFTNLDLHSRDSFTPGLADTFSISILLRGERLSEVIFRANAITLQGNQVFVSSPPPFPPGNWIYLPLLRR